MPAPATVMRLLFKPPPIDCPVRGGGEREWPHLVEFRASAGGGSLSQRCCSSLFPPVSSACFPCPFHILLHHGQRPAHRILYINLYIYWYIYFIFCASLIEIKTEMIHINCTIIRDVKIIVNFSIKCKKPTQQRNKIYVRFLHFEKVYT